MATTSAGSCYLVFRFLSIVATPRENSLSSRNFTTRIALHASRVATPHGVSSEIEGAKFLFSMLEEGLEERM